MFNKSRRWLILGLVIAMVLVIAMSCAPTAAPTPAPTPVAPPEEAVHWIMGSSWDRGTPIQEYSADHFFEVLNRIGGGRLVIDKMYTAGELTGAYEIIPACSEGQVDIVSSAYAFIGGDFPGITFNIGFRTSAFDDILELIMWQDYGGGAEILDEMVATKYNLKTLSNTLSEAEPLYCKEPWTKPEDIVGKKLRTTGLGAEFWEAQGAAAAMMPFGEAIPAIERGVLDACDIVVPYGDYEWGLHKVAPYALIGPVHCLAQQWGIYINRDSYEALDGELKLLIQDACDINRYWYLSEIIPRSMEKYELMQAEGMTLVQVSDELRAQFDEVAKTIADDWYAKDPWVKKTLDSQRAFHEEYVKYRTQVVPQGYTLE